MESQEVKRLRHLSYARGETDAAKCLRTFLQTSFETDRWSKKFYISKKFLHDLLPSLKCLWVLSLSRYKNVNELPDSIGNLIHLRFLDLSHTAIESLPSVVCTLYNLQTLLLSNCYALIELPVDMRKLINLRTLTLADCCSLAKLPVNMRELTSLHYLDVNGTKIEGMPVEIGRLKSLRTLTAFVVGKSTGSSIAELKELQHLRGKLSILNLQNVVDVVHALEANLKYKKELKDLEDVLDKLQPCINLEKLTIRFYGGTSFPNWLGSSNSFSNIQFMCISDCRYCLSLPSFGQLPTLKELCIIRMEFVRIGYEFYGDLNGASVIQPFQSLKTLKFEEMPEWEDWLPSASGGQCSDFPCLQEMRIRNCPKLRGYLPNRLTCLKTLRVSGCEFLRLHDEWAATSSSSSSPNMDYLQNSLEIHINGCPGLLPLIERVEKKFLSTLGIFNFAAIQCLPKMQYLERLTLSNCPTVSSLEFLSHEMMAELTSLDKVVPVGRFPQTFNSCNKGCENLESFSVEGVDQNLSHLNHLRIYDCPNLESFPDGGLPTPNLRHLQVNGCKNLKSFPNEFAPSLPNLYLYVRNCDRVRPSVEWGLQGLVSLTEVSIGGEIWAMLLKEQLLPTTLNSVRIVGLSSLKSLDGEGLRHLTSLQKLSIYGGLQHLTSLQQASISECPNLQFLPEDGLPLSLSFLEIYSCSTLEKRYENRTGQRWAKISHIPCTQINDEVVI
ncbi:unnamed protein product [Malus baccata var. baccata]